MQSYHLKMCKQISRALEAFREGSLDLAQHMRDKQRSYVALEEDYRQAHFERIHQAVTESVASSEIHLELMDCYRRISSYSTNVGRAIMSKDRFGNQDYEEDDRPLGQAAQLPASETVPEQSPRPGAAVPRARGPVRAPCPP